MDSGIVQLIVLCENLHYYELNMIPSFPYKNKVKKPSNPCPSHLWSILELPFKPAKINKELKSSINHSDFVRKQTLIGIF